MSDTSATQSSRRVVRVMLLGLLVVMMTGAIFGFLSGHAEDGGGPLSTRGIVIIATFALIGIGSAIQVLRDLRILYSDSRQLPRRERASIQLLGIALLIGAAVGLIGVFTSTPMDFFSSSPGAMPAWAGILIALSCVTVGPWLTWRWWRAIDEHEQAAYAEGGNIAGHAAMCGGIAWWALASAGLAPQPNVMVLVLAMSFVWSAVWFYRKFY